MMHKNGKKFNYVFVISMYFIFCIAVIVILYNVLNAQVSENNIMLMDNTIGLMAEKMNSSIEIMAGYVEEASALLSSNSDLNLEKRYKEIHDTNVELPYLSIGFINEYGKVLGTSSEKSDFKKYDFYEKIKQEEEVYITQPYRAAGTGTNVITMFDKIYGGDDVVGYVFVTYDLEQVQSIAKSGFFAEDSEIFLMNCDSGNYIRCTSTDDYSAGSWNNIFFEKAGIESKTGYNIDDWQEEMRRGKSNSSIFFEMDGKAYMQSFQKIDNMRDWFVVVRVPNENLAINMNQNIKAMLISLVCLIAATIVLAAMLFMNERYQKNQLRIISEYDALTGVMNRRAYYTVVRAYFDKHGSDKKCAIIFFDMDDFKAVNDIFGHDAGDKMLASFAERLKDVFGGDGFVVRMGGDEFIVFLKNVKSKEDVNEKVAAFRQRLQDIAISGIDALNIRCSIGIAQSPDDADNFEDLEKCADRALYSIKNKDKNGTCWYSEMQ